MDRVSYKLLILLIIYFIVLLQQVTPETADTIITDDAVIVEAASSSSPNSRNKRNVFSYIEQPLFVERYDSSGIILPSSCLTSENTIGQCKSVQSCQLENPDRSDENNIPETIGSQSQNQRWRMYDTCNYLTAQGLQVSGVCCVNKDLKGTILNKQLGPIYPGVPLLANWPPPIPTHPPDHTIPPLPTHPPSPGYPFVTQAPITSTTKKPIKPTTRPPWSKPPTTTARPPWSKPSTTTTHSPPVTSGACGTKNGYQDQERIVGGHNADIGEWPWIAALFNNGRQFCGGSLIDSIHILSAAHCIAHMNSWDVARLTVRLGDYNIKTNSEIRHIEKKVKRVVRHKGFDSRTLYNDISIITMDSPIQFSQQINPICLPAGSDQFNGKTATVIGWGSLRESGPQPAVLQEVNIPIWSNQDCRQKYGHAAPGGIVEHMLCAGQANRDSCSGDSGGPLMVNNGKWTQIGIVSWGIGCGKGQYPGVYTRVTNFLPWINKNLK